MWLRFRRSLWVLLLVLAATGKTNASHIVGGGITYRCLGTSGGFVNYEITIEIYQDCLNGIPEARAEDVPARLGIFSNENGSNFSILDSIGKNGSGSVDSLIVDPNFRNDCVNNPPPICLKRLTFRKTYRLPINSAGYRVIYIRCCRNKDVLNLNNPDQVGTTYFCNIPGTGEGACNNSASFKNYPPQIICVNNPLVYDHSARDNDGDSLSYELCDSYPGGQTVNPKPWPNGAIPSPLSVPGTNPPSFGYQGGFSPKRPMAGNPVIQIDPVTGLLTGTPNIQGRFVVSVCVHEWRNGVMINTTRREFQFTVTNCSKKVVANIPQFSDEYNTYIVECESKTVRFVNTSISGTDYLWNFGVPGGTSTEFEPTFTYPDTGTYTVKLVVNPGSTCSDSISRFVKVYPTFSTNYNFEGLLCPNAPISFTDLSEATYKPITRWQWDFGDGNTSDARNPVHSYAEGGDYKVKLISKSIKGCSDTAVKTVSVERFRPFAGNDTIIIKGESVYFNATGGIDYTWTPSDRLTSGSISNPVGYYPDTGKYNYTVKIVSANGCVGEDNIQVWVVGQGSLFIPNAFTPDGNGINDKLRPIAIGYTKFNYFRVFNRWGELVYETKRIGDGWDGTYKGTRAEMGTYFWILSAVDKDGTTQMKKGDVTLLR